MRPTRSHHRPLNIRLAEEPDDRELARAAAAGDHAAFRDLVRRYEKKVFAVAVGILRDREEARDVSQEAFLKALRSLDTFQHDAQFYTWLYRITVNAALDRVRARKNVVVLDEDALEREAGGDPFSQRTAFDPARALVDKELRQQIQDALLTLPHVHRTVLVLREVEGLSYAEIAEVVGCPTGTVMSRLFHARKRMQAQLALAGAVAAGAVAAQAA